MKLSMGKRKENSILNIKYKVDFLVLGENIFKAGVKHTYTRLIGNKLANPRSILFIKPVLLCIIQYFHMEAVAQMAS